MSESQREMAEGRSGILLWLLVVIGPLGWGSFLFGDLKKYEFNSVARSFKALIVSHAKEVQSLNLASRSHLSSYSPSINKVENQPKLKDYFKRKLVAKKKTAKKSPERTLTHQKSVSRTGRISKFSDLHPQHQRYEHLKKRFQKINSSNQN